MSPRSKLFSFAITEQLKSAMRRLKDRDGISESEQARRALEAFLLGRGIRLDGSDEPQEAVRARPKKAKKRAK